MNFQRMQIDFNPTAINSTLNFFINTQKPFKIAPLMFIATTASETEGVYEEKFFPYQRTKNDVMNKLTFLIEASEEKITRLIGHEKSIIFLFFIYLFHLLWLRLNFLLNH